MAIGKQEGEEVDLSKVIAKVTKASIGTKNPIRANIASEAAENLVGEGMDADNVAKSLIKDAKDQIAKQITE